MAAAKSEAASLQIRSEGLQSQVMNEIHVQMIIMYPRHMVNICSQKHILNGGGGGIASYFQYLPYKGWEHENRFYYRF